MAKWGDETHLKNKYSAERKGNDEEIRFFHSFPLYSTSEVYYNLIGVRTLPMSDFDSEPFNIAGL